MKQSGQFVNFSNSQKTLGAKLRFEGDELPGGARKLTGDVSCVNGKTQEFEGQSTFGNKAVISGTLDGQPFTANLRRDPPDAGTPGAARSRFDRVHLQDDAALDLPRRDLRAREARRQHLRGRRQGEEARAS